MRFKEIFSKKSQTIDLESDRQKEKSFDITNDEIIYRRLQLKFLEESF
jgi:hypothetical protein